MKIPKTTLVGALTVISALVTGALYYLQTGQMPDPGPVISAVAQVLGLSVGGGL